LNFFRFPDAFPPKEVVETFRINLNNRIIRNLNLKRLGFDLVELSTNYVPEDLLSTVLDESGIFHKDYQLERLFPPKTATTIRVIHDSKEIRVTMTVPIF
jgi:hypothetical protein